MPLLQGLYLAQQARQLQQSNAAAAAPGPNHTAALLIQSEAQLQRSIAQHSPTAARVPSASTGALAPHAHALASHSMVALEVAADTGEAGLLYWHDISSAGKEEGFVSSSGRFIAHSMVGLFALFFMMRQYGDAEGEAWPIRSDTNNIRASWWWTFSPLLVLDFACLLALPSFFITLSRNGFVVAARRASQRSGVLSLLLLGNPCLMVSELVLASYLAVPDSRHVSYTSFFVFAPSLIGAILLVLFAMAALFSTSSQSVKASTVTLFTGVCLLVFCIICPLRFGDQVQWSWWAIMCPMCVNSCTPPQFYCFK